MTNDKVYIADSKHRSITLLMRRAFWSNNNGYPRHNGYRIDPRYVRHNGEDYQNAVAAWWDGLDKRAQDFLGRDYAAMAGRKLES